MVDTAVRLNYDILPIVVEFSEKKQVTMQHTATHCNTLQHTATHFTPHPFGFGGAQQDEASCNATKFNILQHTATNCNTICITLQRTLPIVEELSEKKQVAMQHSSTHCNTLQRNL